MSKRASVQLLPDELDRQIDLYFDKCKKSEQTYKMKRGDVRIRAEWPSIVGLALFLNSSKTKLYEYANGNYPVEWLDHVQDVEGHPLKEFAKQYGKQEIINRYRDSLSRAKARIEEIIVMASANGDIEPKIAALLLSQWGYTAKTEQETNNNMTLKWEGVDPTTAGTYSK